MSMETAVSDIHAKILAMVEADKQISEMRHKELLQKIEELDKRLAVLAESKPVTPKSGMSSKLLIGATLLIGAAIVGGAIYLKS